MRANKIFISFIDQEKIILLAIVNVSKKEKKKHFCFQFKLYNKYSNLKALNLFISTKKDGFSTMKDEFFIQTNV